MCLGSLDGERVERFHDLAQNLGENCPDVREPY